MIILNDKVLLFIEPKSRQIDDDCYDQITRYLEEKMQLAIPRNDYTRGFHTCACGEHSTSNTFSVTLGEKNYVTNSLAVHYVKNHRSEVPETELQKIIEAINYEASINQNTPKPRHKL